MEKVVITGANGFIGSALSRYLADRGVLVYALSSHADRITKHPNITPISISLMDENKLASVIGEIKPDAIYHMAWQGMDYESKNDMDIQLANIPIYMNIIKAAAGNCRLLIMPGSTSEYAYSGEPVDGTSEPAPGDAYATVKSRLQSQCREYADELGITLVWLLIGSVYGPGRIDNNILTYAIRSFMRSEETAFTRLEQQWDYLYIDDLLEAMYLVGEKCKTSKVYALGSGDVRPLSEYITAVRDVINPELPIGIGKLPYKNGKSPDNNIPNISSIVTDTNYEAKISFEEGIKMTIDYFREAEENGWMH